MLGISFRRLEDMLKLAEKNRKGKRPEFRLKLSFEAGKFSWSSALWAGTSLGLVAQKDSDGGLAREGDVE
jgi:hypothetical protein